MTLGLKEYNHPNNQTKIFVPIDDEAIDWATLAALYSRSTDSAQLALDKVKSARSRVVETYMVKYGHRSIGDMVDVKLFIENIPIFLAYIIEHHSLFRGQESSTRYIDFSKQELPKIYPVKGAKFYRDWYADTLRKYSAATESVLSQLAEHHKIDPESKGDTVKYRAIKARTFDICRGMLPVSALTNVAWFGNINSIRGHLAWMRKEYQDVTDVVIFCNLVHSVLNEHYPEASKEDLDRPSVPWSYNRDDDAIQLMGELDFGSLRDLNRHRVGWHDSTSMTKFGPMHSWYTLKYEEFGVEPPETDNDYTRAVLGQVVNYKYVMPDYQENYVAKLRTKYNVHPTLRDEILYQFRGTTPYRDLLSINTDREAFGKYGYYENRGEETIVVKG